MRAGALYVCAGRDPFELVERGVAAAAKLSGGARPSREKEVPPSLDLFGWCAHDLCRSAPLCALSEYACLLLAWHWQGAGLGYLAAFTLCEGCTVGGLSEA
jgi:hypothetical protein